MAVKFGKARAQCQFWNCLHGSANLGTACIASGVGPLQLSCIGVTSLPVEILVDDTSFENLLSSYMLGSYQVSQALSACLTGLMDRTWLPF